MGANVLALSGDLADPAAPARLVSDAQQFCGGLDALVSNAGIAIPALLTELPLEGWDRIISVHTRAAWLLAKAAYPALREARGAMVAIGSINGSFPYVGHGAYAAAKAALTSLCQTLAMEWASDGIRVSVVSPGLIRTQMNAATYRDPVLAAERDAMIPLGRSGSVDDVAGVVYPDGCGQTINAILPRQVGPLLGVNLDADEVARLFDDRREVRTLRFGMDH